MAKRKASPGGEAGATLVATDEVEATNHRHEIARRCYPRPHPVRLRPDHRSSGMTATGSHIDFGFAARSTTLQGKAFLCPGRFYVNFYCSNIATWRAGHAAAPTHNNLLPTAPHPATRKGGHLLPKEKACATPLVPPATHSPRRGRRFLFYRNFTFVR